MNLRGAHRQHCQRLHASSERVSHMSGREDVRRPGQYELPHPPALVDDPLDTKRQASRPLSFVNDERTVTCLRDKGIQLTHRIRLDCREDFLIVERYEEPNIKKVPDESSFARLARANNVHHSR